MLRVDPVDAFVEVDRQRFRNAGVSLLFALRAVGRQEQCWASSFSHCTNMCSPHQAFVRRVVTRACANNNTNTHTSAHTSAHTHTTRTQACT